VENSDPPSRVDHITFTVSIHDYLFNIPKLTEIYIMGGLGANRVISNDRYVATPLHLCICLTFSDKTLFELPQLFLYIFQQIITFRCGRLDFLCAVTGSMNGKKMCVRAGGDTAGLMASVYVQNQ